MDGAEHYIDRAGNVAFKAPGRGGLRTFLGGLRGSGQHALWGSWTPPGEYTIPARFRSALDFFRWARGRCSSTNTGASSTQRNVPNCTEVRGRGLLSEKKRARKVVAIEIPSFIRRRARIDCSLLRGRGRLRQRLRSHFEGWALGLRSTNWSGGCSATIREVSEHGFWEGLSAVAEPDLPFATSTRTDAMSSSRLPLRVGFQQGCHVSTAAAAKDARSSATSITMDKFSVWGRFPFLQPRRFRQWARTSTSAPARHTGCVSAAVVLH